MTDDSDLETSTDAIDAAEEVHEPAEEAADEKRPTFVLHSPKPIATERPSPPVPTTLQPHVLR